jgi:hypothetical protein
VPVYLPGLTSGGVGYGGGAYGTSPYGSGAFPRLPFPTTGGYGGAAYGTSPYGSLDTIPPRVSSANPLDGFRVEVFFSEELRNNAALTNASNYTFSTVYGAPLATSLVETGNAGSYGGFTSVIVTHSGSTLGGQYQATVGVVEDLAGNTILNSPASFFAFGDTTQVAPSLASPDDGRTVRLDFTDSRGSSQDLLAEADFTPGVESVASYTIETDYPVDPTLSSLVQESATLSRVEFDLHPMTSAEYTLTVGPSEAYSYDGSVLPDDSPDFTGAEVGSGTSSTSGSGLVLSKSSGSVYGWSFADTSGRMTTGTSFRVDFGIDVTGASITPALFNATLATLSASDGAIQINLLLEDLAGTKVITVDSGALSLQVPAAWDSAARVISVVRNQKGDFYSLLLDGVPLVSWTIASATGVASYSAGSAVVLASSPGVGLFRLTRMDLTSSATVFTSSWNFIHGLTSTFTGSSVLAQDRVRTRYGPLVRGWGDETPATKEDVEVRINGTAVLIDRVNPYVGEIFPEIPIPKAAAGVLTVEADYIWFSNPRFPLTGLNTRGLTLNNWSHSVGHTPGAQSPVPATSKGVAKTGRFPMAVGLGPLSRPRPKRVAHRYLGFQKGHSALLNQSTTLLLNQDPNAVAKGKVSAEALRQSGAYTGAGLPENAETPWELSGVDTGSPVGDGTYRLVDASSGPYGEGEAAFYRRAVDLSLETIVREAGRFYLESYTLDGVFTGVGVGAYDGNALCLVGALVIDGVHHFGLLRDAENPHLSESWVVGPSALAATLTVTTLEVPTSSLPGGIGPGSRFRIPSGNQAGTYQVAECGVVHSLDGGTTTLTISPGLPADILGFGNDTFEVVFETDWSLDFYSVRVIAQFPQNTASVSLGGAVSGEVASGEALTPFPAQTALLLPATQTGYVFWGSVSRRALNASIWDMTQYSSSPERMLTTVQGLTIRTEMSGVPEADPNDPWYQVGGFGFSGVYPGGNSVVLEATSGSATAAIPEGFSYERVEPYLTPKVTTDSDMEFLVESGCLGAGDAQISIRDGVREARLVTLLYTQGATERELVVDLPAASLSGLQAPVDAGWAEESSSSLPDPFVRGQVLEIVKASTNSGAWYQDLTAPTSVDYEGLVSEARISFQSHTLGSVGAGPAFGVSVPVSSSTVRRVSLAFGDGELLLLDEGQTTIATLAHTWDDAQTHTYRMSADPTADLVVVSVDDVVVGSAALSDFSSSSGGARAHLGMYGDGVATFKVFSTNATPLRPVALPGLSLGRTLGLLKRSGASNPDDIDSYKIPRADSTQALNSSLTAIPVLMDWRVRLQARVYLDPAWGASFFRPDLALPPGASGDFVTETTDPSAAWATLEYSELPVVRQSRGSVSFGAPDARSVTKQRWYAARYRIRGAIDGFNLAPHGMVLNRASIMRSGEFLQDLSLEISTIPSRSSTLLYVPDSAIHADRVFAVQVDGVVWASSDWAFDKGTQNIIFTRVLPSGGYPVTVTFAAGPPYTKAYLCGQPIENSPTILNEGTPPIPKSRDAESTSTVAAGSQINDRRDILDPDEGIVLNDPYRYIEFTDGPDALYASLEFCEEEDGESVHLSSMCDGPGPGEGLSEIGVSGQFTSDVFSVEGGPGGPWGSQSPAIRGSAAKFNQFSVLMVSGGGYQQGEIGPASSILYPNQQGADGTVTPGMGLNQSFRFLLVDVSPREEDMDIQGLLGDNVPPSLISGGVVPDGTPGATGNGAARYELSDLASVTYSQLGPWGGLAALSVRSLLAGGAPQPATSFLLSGGAAIPGPTVTSGYIEAAN